MTTAQYRHNLEVLYTDLEAVLEGRSIDLAKVSRLASKLGFEYLDLSNRAAVNQAMDDCAGNAAIIDLGL